MQTMQKTKLVMAIAAVLSLTACGGGGGGSSSNDDTSNDDGGSSDDSGSSGDTSSFEVLAEPAVAVLESDSGVKNPSQKVALIDSGLDTSHEEFEGDNGVGEPILTGREVYVPAQRCVDHDLGGCTDTTDVTDESNHGTASGSIIAGQTLGYSENAELSIYDISDSSDGDASVSSIAYALGMAANDNHRIANLSYQVDIVEFRQATVGNDSISEDAFNDFAAQDIAAVVAAGNLSENYSINADGSWDEEIKLDDSIIDQVLVVGALSGDRLADYSNYAGENELIQSRFLVTQGSHAAATNDGGTGQFYGTSFAAPVVSAALATLISKWDHLTMTEATQLLLNTTDRSFANENNVETDDYGVADCGESGNVDCGLYTYGQGRLDLASAMEPSGEVTTTTAATVDEAKSDSSESSDVAETAMVSSAGTRGVEAAIAKAAGDITVFDDLGRDYQADLSGSLNAFNDPTQSTGYRMSEFMSSNAMGFAKPAETESNGLRHRVSVDGNGHVSTASVEADSRRLGLSAYHFGNGQSAPDEMGNHQMGMMSFSGTTPMADQIDQANGLSASFSLNDHLSVEGRYWQGFNRLSMDDKGQTARMDNLQVGLGFEPIEGVKLSGSYGSLDEKNGFLGMMGMGGFSTQDGSTMNLVSAGITVQHAGFSAFANYQTGTAQANFGGGLIQRLEGDVEQMAAGMSYGFNSGRSQVAFVASRPMHLTGGEATIKAATGRDTAGNISYEDRRVAFGEADAPMNYEMGFRHQVNRHTMAGLNMVRTENPAGGQVGEADHGIVGMLTYRF